MAGPAVSNTAWAVPFVVTLAPTYRWDLIERKGSMLKTFAISVACVGTLAVSTLLSAGPAGAAPSGFSNAQETVDSLRAQGYNVVLNGATVFPLSSCKVVGVEGLNNSNINSAGARIDPAHFDTVYVDISCRGG
jgi:hypothetical protein